MFSYREIYIFVGGTSPQIITETIYALATARPPIFPDALYIITTKIGKEIIIDNLINRKILKNLFEEYEIPEIKINEENFLIPKLSSGKEINDITTEEENNAMADLIITFVRSLCSYPKHRLHCSIAGGRKTMSFYLGAALQLFGRPWDKLYHVLVTPEFESNPEFFYKTRQDKRVKFRDKEGKIREISTRSAKIYLLELPFIRLGSKLKLNSVSFKELVEEGQSEIEMSQVQPNIVLNLSAREIQVGETSVELNPSLMFIYSVLVRQKVTFCPYPERPYCLDCQDCYRELSALFSQDSLKAGRSDFLAIWGGKELKWNDFLGRWKSGLSVETIRQYISKVNKKIETQLNNKSLSDICRIVTLRIYGSSRYGLKIEKGKIEIV